MTLETIVTVAAAIADILTFMIGIGVVLYNQGSFKAETTTRLGGLEKQFDNAHLSNKEEIHELKMSINRIDSTVATLREDRVRLNKIEDEMKELRQLVASHAIIATVTQPLPKS